MVCSPSLEYLPLLLLQRFHGDGMRRASLGAEAAADALLFVLDDGAGLARATVRRRRRRSGCSNQGCRSARRPAPAARSTRRRQFSGQTSTHPAHRMHFEPSKMVLTWHFRQRSPSARPCVSSNPSSTSAIPMRRLAGSTGMVLARESAGNRAAFPSCWKMRKRLSTVLLRLAVEVSVDGPRRAMPVGHRFHQHARAECHVAAGEDAGRRGHQVLVDLENSARRHLNVRHRRPGRTGPPAARWPAPRYRSGMTFSSSLKAGLKRPFSSKTETQRAHPEAGDDAVRADDLLGSPPVVHGDALVLGFVDFALPGGHLLARFQAHQAHLFGAGTHRHAGRVQGRLQALRSGFGGAGIATIPAPAARPRAPRRWPRCRRPPPTTRLPSSISYPRLTLIRKSMPL